MQRGSAAAAADGLEGAEFAGLGSCGHHPNNAVRDFNRLARRMGFREIEPYIIDVPLKRRDGAGVELVQVLGRALCGYHVFIGRGFPNLYSV